MSSLSPDQSSQVGLSYPQPPTFELLTPDPLSSQQHPSKNHRVPQPKHSHLPLWAPPWQDTGVSTAPSGSASSSKMLIVHVKNTFLKDDIAGNNVYNSSLCNNNAWKCVECLKVFYMKNRLKLHYMLEHNVSYCHLCDVFLEVGEEQEGHQRRIHEGKTCDFCYILINPTDLVEHHRMEHDVISCPFCLAYIRPSSELSEHIVHTHRPKVNPNEPDVVKLFKQTGRESFRCYLCAENRRRELTGHFNIYHKIHTHVLAQLFIKYKVNLALFIEGFTEYGPTKDITCEVCEENIPELVPTEFHFIYCRHQFHCAHCNNLFSTIETFDSHNALLHARHPCTLDCNSLAYNSAENLTKHYLAYHKVEACAFCDDLIPAEEIDGIGGLNRHVKMAHACLGNNAGYREGKLMEIVMEEDSNIGQLSCLLCNDIIPSTSPNDIYVHFHQDHSVISQKLLTLIGGNLLTKSVETENVEELKNVDANKEVESDKDDTVEDISTRKLPTIFDESSVECLFELNEVNTDLKTKCELCPEEVPSLLQYIDHIYSSHNIKVPNKYLKCDTCILKKGKSKGLLLKHFEHYVEVENHRDDDKKFKCNLCDNEISLIEAFEHYKTLHDSEKDLANLKKVGYKCRFCKKPFWSINIRNQHEIDNHFEDELNKGSFYSCLICANQFTTPILLKNHTKNCNNENSTASLLLYHCLKCSAVLTSIMDTTKHFESNHKDCLRYLCLIELCSSSFKDRRSARRHYHTVHANKKKKTLKEKKKGKFLCKVCGLSFMTKNSLGGHKHVHTTQKRMLKCTICPEMFMTKAIRNSHMQLMHIGIDRYKCVECDKSFQSRTSLSMHRTTHLPLFKCTYCEKEFSRRDSFKEHLLIHEGPRHQCPHCPRAFTQMSNLRRHLRIHTGEKPYKCPFCEKTFSDAGACKSHTSVHTREQECKCDICGKSYSKKQKLKYHMKTHTGKDMHPCHICNKEFVGLYNLRVHLTSHENAIQASIYVCDLCSKECKNKISLSKHRKRCKGIPIKPKKLRERRTIDPISGKRQYIKKKNKPLEIEEDDVNEEYSDLIKNYELRNSNTRPKLKISSENEEDTQDNQEFVDDHNKDLISFMDISQMMVTTMETEEHEVPKTKSSSDDSDDDNISIKKLKTALIDKINSSKAIANPVTQFRYNSLIPSHLAKTSLYSKTSHHLPNKDIIKSEFLDKLSSAIQSTTCPDSSRVRTKKREVDIIVECGDLNNANLQFVDVKVEPKEEIIDEFE